MANIAIFKSGKEAQYLRSVDPSPYLVDPTALEGNEVVNDPDIIVNPDISTVKNIPLKFWKRSGNNVIEMTQVEKDAIASRELTERKSSADTFDSNSLSIFTALIKVINVRLPAGQKITRAELITAIKEEII